MTIKIPAVEGPRFTSWMRMIGHTELLRRLAERLGPEIFMGTLYEEFIDRRNEYWKDNAHRIKHGDQYPGDWPELFKLVGSE